MYGIGAHGVRPCGPYQNCGYTCTIQQVLRHTAKPERIAYELGLRRGGDVCAGVCGDIHIDVDIYKACEAYAEVGAKQRYRHTAAHIVQHYRRYLGFHSSGECIHSVDLRHTGHTGVCAYSAYKMDLWNMTLCGI